MNKKDKNKFISIFSYFTKIPENKIYNYLKTHSVASLIEHPQSLDITKPQLHRISMISDIYKFCERNEAIKNFNIENADKVAQYMRSYFPSLYDKEHMVATFLDEDYRILGTKLISTGTLNASIVHPRDVFRDAIAHKSNYFILAHNHPSGDLHPSREDLNVTRRIKEAGKALNIELIDHIIVNHSKDFYSFKDNKAISFDILPEVKERESFTSYEKREYKKTLDNKVDLLNKITKIPKMKLKNLVEDSIHDIDKIFDNPSDYNLDSDEINLIKGLDELRKEADHHQKLYHNYKYKVTSPESILDYMKNNFDLNNYVTTVTFLNTKNEIIHCTAVDRNIPVENNITNLIKDAINYSSNSVILFQKNDQLDNINPNLVLISEKAKDICNLIGIRFLDCVYLNKSDELYSFKQEDLIDFDSRRNTLSLEAIDKYAKEQTKKLPEKNHKNKKSCLEI